MKKVICLVVMLLGLIVANAQTPAKWSDYILKDVTATTRVVGYYDSVGVHKNGKFRVPYTYSYADSNLKFPQLGGHTGLIKVDATGRVSSANYIDILADARDTEIVISNYGVSPGSVDVDLAYSVNKLLGGYIIGVGLVVNAPDEFATPPARTSWPVVTVDGFMLGGFSVPIASTSGTGLMPLYGSIGYVSTIDFRWVYSFMSSTSTLYAYMVKPTSAFTDYQVSFKIFLPI